MKLQLCADDFIHASRVPAGAERELLLTQLPLPNTVRDFWSMVWQEKLFAVLLILTEHEWRQFGESVLPQGL